MTTAENHYSQNEWNFTDNTSWNSAKSQSVKPKTTLEIPAFHAEEKQYKAKQKGESNITCLKRPINAWNQKPAYRIWASVNYLFI